MSAADTVARMLALVPWLLERPGASVREAAEAFGVPPRTLLEDLDTIGYCGLPGLGGGDLFEIDLYRDRIVVRMAHDLDEPLRPTPREALRLVLAGEAVAAAMPEDVPALRSALDAIRSSAGIPAGVSVEHDDDVLERGLERHRRDARQQLDVEADERRVLPRRRGDVLQPTDQDRHRRAGQLHPRQLGVVGEGRVAVPGALRLGDPQL
ncbi:MAG: hypothetical protein KY437_10815, partial [Actinobacteria bacterium]|nr:hypothetical protein [Actinomycetota bacterium]